MNLLASININSFDFSLVYNSFFLSWTLFFTEVLITSFLLFGSGIWLASYSCNLATLFTMDYTDRPAHTFLITTECPASISFTEITRISIVFCTTSYPSHYSNIYIYII